MHDNSLLYLSRLLAHTNTSSISIFDERIVRVKQKYDLKVSLEESFLETIFNRRSNDLWVITRLDDSVNEAYMHVSINGILIRFIAFYLVRSHPSDKLTVLCLTNSFDWMSISGVCVCVCVWCYGLYIAWLQVQYSVQNTHHIKYDITERLSNLWMPAPVHTVSVSVCSLHAVENKKTLNVSHVVWFCIWIVYCSKCTEFENRVNEFVHFHWSWRWRWSPFGRARLPHQSILNRKNKH